MLLSLWMQWPIIGVRWVIVKITVFSSVSRWLNTSFWQILSSETTKCIYVYEQSRSSLYAEYASCVGPPQHQGAPLLSKIISF